MANYLEDEKRLEDPFDDPDMHSLENQFIKELVYKYKLNRDDRLCFADNIVQSSDKDLNLKHLFDLSRDKYWGNKNFKFSQDLFISIWIFVAISERDFGMLSRFRDHPIFNDGVDEMTLMLKDELITNAFEYCIIQLNIDLIDYFINRCARSQYSVYINDYCICYLIKCQSFWDTREILLKLLHNDVFLIIHANKDINIKADKIINYREMLNPISFDYEKSRRENEDLENTENRFNKHESIDNSSNHWRGSKYLSVSELDQKEIDSDMLVTGREFNKVIKSKEFKKLGSVKPFTKYLERQDVIEISLKTNGFSKSLSLINLLYPNIHQSNKGWLGLLKVLIDYEKLDIFEAIFWKSDQSESFIDDADFDENQNYHDYSLFIAEGFITAVESSKFMIAFYLFRTYTDDILDNKISWLDVLINSFKTDSYHNYKLENLEERLYILQNLIKHIKYEMAIDFLDVTKIILGKETKHHFLVYSINPVKIIVILIEIFKEINVIHPMLTFKANEIISILSKTCNKILWRWYSIRDVEDLIFDKTYDNELILDCIARINIDDILENSILENIVNNIYYGNFQREPFYRKSVLFKTCFMTEFASQTVNKHNPLIICEYKEETKRKRYKEPWFKKLKRHLFYPSRANESMNSNKFHEYQPGHQFQFEIWKHALDVKYTVNTMLIIPQAFFLLYFSQNLIHDWTHAHESYTKIIGMRTDGTTDWSTTNYWDLLLYCNHHANNAKLMFELLFIMNIGSIAYVFEDLQNINKFEIKSRISIFNLLGALSYLSWLAMHYTEYMNDYVPDPYGELSDMAVIIQNQFEHGKFLFKYFVVILTCFQFLRIIGQMRINKIFGPMVKTMTLMIKDVIMYLAFMSTIFFIFWWIGQLLFQEITSFDSTYSSSQYLFSALLGNMNFADFDELDDVPTEIGKLYIVIYILVCAIMLLNFLIAILTNTHSRIVKYERSLYLREIILLIKHAKFDRYYSSIISISPPFNLLMIPFIPFILCTKSEKVNNFFLYIEYMLVAVIALLIFTAFTVMIYPVSFIYAAASKFAKCLAGNYKGIKDIVLRILDAISFAIIGPIILLVWAIIDYYYFIINLWSKKIRMKYTYSNIDYESSSKHAKKVVPSSLRSKVSRANFITDAPHLNHKEDNPIKAGVSNLTIKMLKITMINLRDIAIASNSNISKGASWYVPTKLIIEEMREHLLIFEQLNSILLGVSYDQDMSYFDSSAFKKLVEGFQKYTSEASDESKEISIDLNSITKQDDTDSKGNIKTSNIFEMNNGGNTLVLQTDNVKLTKREAHQPTHAAPRCENPWKSYWGKTIINFIMTNSNKYILDQYNLIKTFVIHNSIEVDTFQSPHKIQSYMNEKYKRMMRKNKKIMKLVSKETNKFTSLREISKATDISQSETKKERICNINAFIMMLNDIETKSVFIKNPKKYPTTTQNVEMDEYCRFQLSLINWNRNHSAISNLEASQ